MEEQPIHVLSSYMVIVINEYIFYDIPIVHMLLINIRIHFKYVLGTCSCVAELHVYVFFSEL